VHRVPFPPNRGDRIRSFHLLRRLAQRFDVSLATLADEPVPDETRRELDRLCARVAIEPVGSVRWLRAATSLATGHSATEGLFASPRLKHAVCRWAAERTFDAALVFCSSMVQYLDCPGLAAVPAVIDLVDVDSQKWFDYADKTSGLKRRLFQLEGRRLRRLECTLPGRAAAITLVSEAEANLFRGFCPNGRMLAVPNGVDLDYFRPHNTGPGGWQSLAHDRANLVFVGALDYRANVDAACWFAAHVWPLLRQRLPHVSLALVGRNPAAAVQRLATQPGIRVFASVPDVRPYAAAADVVIAPLRIARGIQNKVLEAMAMGKPVVCSPAALEGIAAVPDKHLVLADEPGQWSEAIADLLHDEERAFSLGMAARRFVQRHHAWDTTLAPLDELLFAASQPTASPQDSFAATAAHQDAPLVDPALTAASLTAAG
jgi:sugar transferase (PEP-CTERM/EpsH1 system associated)